MSRTMLKNKHIIWEKWSYQLMNQIKNGRTNQTKNVHIVLMCIQYVQKHKGIRASYTSVI